MRRRRERGFSLLEVLAAMTLFALIASAIGTLASSSLMHTTQNRHYTIAAMLAQQELEDLRSLPYASITSRSALDTVEGQLYSIGTAVQPDVPATGMSHIRVTVTWYGPEGSKSYAVETIFTNVTG
jgi:general secretion pathway protein I